MSMTSLALLLSLATSVGSGVDAPVAMNERGIKIPYNLTVSPNEVNDVILYVSIDQGKVWSRGAVIKPTDKFFPFQAPTDGQYWFNVAVAYRNGTQVPADINRTPPQQKVIIDTQKPTVRITSAERIGDEMSVSWEIQEPNADLASLKVEYRPTDAASGTFWVAAPASPGLVGSVKFRPNTPNSVTVRVSMNDIATNLGWTEKVVGTSDSPIVAPPVSPITTVAAPSMPPSGVSPLPAPVSVVPEPQPVSMPAPAPVSIPNNLPAETTPVVTPLATSNRSVAPAAPPVATHTTFRTEQPEVFNTNEPQITVDYEIDHGPSGVSKVEVFLTQDDGRTWVKWQELSRNDLNRGEPTPAATPNNKLPVTVRMPDREGTFGFRLVPCSGAQISAGSPQGGTEPEFRIQYDRTQPYVELFKPEAEAGQKNVLVLQWKATDVNFGDKPIRIYWSEQGNGDWHAVNATQSLGASDPGGLPNTGKFNWEVPTGLPLKIFLKIVAEDKAGNVGEAVTPQSLIVDLHKPVGRFKGIIDTKRRN